MPKRDPSSDSGPESLTAVWKAVHGLKKDFEDLRIGVNNPTFWAKFWGERNWSIATTLVVLAALSGGVWYVGGLILDSHIGSAIQPLQQQTQKLDGDIQRLTGIVGTLQTQVAALRYSALPPKELKAHAEELKKLKNTLAQTPSSAPGYWPTAFKVIELLSQSTFIGVDKLATNRELSYENITSRPPGGMSITTNQRVFLKSHVEGLIFKDSIIRFDPNVELVNDVFINCIFLLPIQDNPSKPLQEIGKTLLASDLVKVTLNAS